jgi:hypothetical protein
VGPAFDFCVRFSAEEARREGFAAFVIEDACRGIDVDGSMAATRASLAALGVPCIAALARAKGAKRLNQPRCYRGAPAGVCNAQKRLTQRKRGRTLQNCNNRIRNASANGRTAIKPTLADDALSRLRGPHGLPSPPPDHLRSRRHHLRLPPLRRRIDPHFGKPAGRPQRRSGINQPNSLTTRPRESGDPATGYPLARE